MCSGLFFALELRIFYDCTNFGTFRTKLNYSVCEFPAVFYVLFFVMH